MSPDFHFLQEEEAAPRRMTKLIATILLISAYASAQTGSASLNHISRSSTLTFVQRDGTCIRGAIVKADATTIEVEPFKQAPVILRRSNVLQVSQGDALVYSGRSSWNDVIATHLVPREALLVTLNSGKQLKGSPIKRDSTGIHIRRGPETTFYPKSDIKTVDYLRWKPESDGFSYMLEEAPYMALFYPELYYRAAGLEGRIPVRIYDSTKPEDDSPAVIKSCPYGAPAPPPIPIANNP